ncbi:MAG: DUF5110 domain-containing protein, partial [Bacteroidales bacterium]|nr:DUF5110 domain-containing protein [Bacteroidales bacterium]
LTYGYEKGAFSTIQFRWDDASRTLTIGDRAGEFPGMLQERRFTVILVEPSNPKAYDPDADGKEVDYRGKEIKIIL